MRREALASPALSFTRDGRRLLAIEEDGVAITDTSTHATFRIAIDTPLAAIGFPDQIWIAHGRLPELSCFGATGARMTPALPLSGSPGELIPAAAAGPAALWTGDPPLVICEQQGSLRSTAAPAGALLLPLTSRRWITVHGARVTVPSGLTCELGAGTRVIAGAFVFDATAVLLLAERQNGRELVLVGLSNGRPQSRQSIAGVELRIAARRGLVAAQYEPGRIGILDLRSGRVIGEVVRDMPVTDFVLDPDGERIALCGTSRTVELVDVRAAMEAARATYGQMPVPPVEEPAHGETEHEETAREPSAKIDAPQAFPLPAARHELVRPLDLAALAPIEHRSSVDRATALTLLDRELRTVALWTLCAITKAWDSRRIGYGNEGLHPFEHEVAALLGMNTGFATEHVAAAREHLAAHESECAAAANPRHCDMPLGALAVELGLSPLALDILLVVAAPVLWSNAARLFGILGNERGRALVDEALVSQILEPRANRHDIAAELDPRAPLVRFGLIAIEATATRPFAELIVDPIALARLRCETPNLGPAVTVRGSDRALEELALGAQVIPDALAALARTNGAARISVRGRPGSGRRTLVASLAAEAGRALGVIDVSVLARHDRAARLRIALRRVQLAGLLPCVVGLEVASSSEHDERDVFREVLRSHPGPLALILPFSAEPPLDPGYVAIDIPVLAESERFALWHSALADAGLTGDSAMLAARYRIGPGTIQRAILSARKHADAATADVTSVAEQFIRQTRDGRLGAHARRVDRLSSWDNLVLPTDIRDSLRELVARVRYRRTVFETWGMDRHMATSRGLTALFSGPPGTGKTLVAGVIARELGLDLYQVELSKLVSKWVGETERNLASVFDAAEDGQVILLFDEADSLFAKRTEVRSSNDRYANLEVNYLLQRLDSFEGIAILTTNAASAIDPAFKRRMSFRLSFPFPDEETREELWRAHLPDTLPIAGPLALDKLAHKYQLSGGYIRNACLRAAFLAAEDRTALAQTHLERAVALEFAELGKLSAGGALD